MGEVIVNELMNVYYLISEFEHNASIPWFDIKCELCSACPTFEMADGLRNKYENGDSNFKQYIYEFEGAYQPFLAPHAVELPFVFDWGARFAAYYRLPWNESLSEAMIRAQLEVLISLYLKYIIIMVLMFYSWNGWIMAQMMQITEVY